MEIIQAYLDAESNSQGVKEEDVIAMVPLRLWRGRIYVYMYKIPLQNYRPC